jgi:hypothetical protein
MTPTLVLVDRTGIVKQLWVGSSPDQTPRRIADDDREGSFHHSLRHDKSWPLRGRVQAW